MKKKGYVYVILGIVVILTAILLLQKTSEEAKAPTISTSTSTATYKDMVKVSNLKEGDLIKSNFILEGEARGNWYFEGSFPVKVLDSNGKILTTTPASVVTGDWMTTDYVPFTVKLTFDAGKETEGFIVLMKDNPSGLPEKDDSFKIPVSFLK